MSIDLHRGDFSTRDLQAMAENVAKSKLFAGIDTPQAAFTLMLLCQSEGLHPAQALRRYHIIGGKPSMRADAMQAEFQRQGGVVRWDTSTDTECSARFIHPTHAPEPGVRITWTMERAQKAGVTGNPTWKKYPDAMLRARVISEGVRMVMPGIVAGIYTPEEVQDFAPPKAAPAPAPAESVTIIEATGEVVEPAAPVPAPLPFSRWCEVAAGRLGIEPAALAEKCVELAVERGWTTAELPAADVPDMLATTFELHRDEYKALARSLAEGMAA